MTRQALTEVVQRSISDAAFRGQLATDATSALRGYDLTAEEAGALRGRDAAKLAAFGVDIRTSKIFTLDPGTGASSTLTGGEQRDAARVFIGDGFDNTQAVETSAAAGSADAALTTNDAVSRGQYATDEGQLTGAFQTPTEAVSGSGYATDEGQITGAFQTPTDAVPGGDGDLQQ